MLAVSAVGDGHFVFAVLNFRLRLEPAEFLEPGRVVNHPVLLSGCVVLADLADCRFDKSHKNPLKKITLVEASGRPSASRPELRRLAGAGAGSRRLEGRLARQAF